MVSGGVSHATLVHILLHASTTLLVEKRWGCDPARPAHAQLTADFWESPNFYELPTHDSNRKRNGLLMVWYTLCALFWTQVGKRLPLVSFHPLVAAPAFSV